MGGGEVGGMNGGDSEGGGVDNMEEEGEEKE